jgi:hypothetical protein
MANVGINLTPPNSYDEDGNLLSIPDTLLTNKAEQLSNLVTNELMSRSALMSRFFDPRRNINREAGYPDIIRPRDYQLEFERNGIANRVISFEPMECFKVQPEIYEDEDETNETGFEQSIQEVDRMLSNQGGIQNYLSDPDLKMSPIWYFLRKADILSGVGSYGIVLYGLNDNSDYSQPVAGFEEVNSDPANLYPERYNEKEKKPKKGKDVTFASGKSSLLTNAERQGIIDKRIEKIYKSHYRDTSGIYQFTVNAEKVKQSRMKLLYLRAYPEYLAQVVRWESNPTSPRYGMPVMYLLTLNDPTQVNQYSGVGMDKSSMYVHWTRVLHIAESDMSSNESLAFPRLQNVFNYVYNCTKISASSPEGYWKSAFTILSAETNPQLGGDVEVDETAVKRSIENLQNSLQRSWLGKGMSLKTVAPSVTEPTSHLDMQLKLICITKGWPKRIWEGSERGELASSQDEQEHVSRMEGRQVTYLSPRLIAPFFNSLIMFGVVAEPKSGGFYINWPPLRKENPTQRAQRFLTKVQAYGAATGGNITTLFSEKDILTKLDDFTNKEADAILEAAAERIEEQQQAELEAQQAQTQAMADAGYLPEEDVEAGLTPEEIQQGQAIDSAANPPVKE